MGYYLKEEFPLKTLKKTLVLVLAVALCFGLVGTAFASNLDTFTDSKDVSAEYVEATDLFVGLGIVKGMTATTLVPQGTYTRAQAAKIVATLVLGVKIADKLSCSAAPFKDVAADYWASGYIAYCVEEGIIAGYGDGNFGPEDELSGYAFAKMLLVALGKDASAYVGEQWTINVAKDAFKVGLFDDVTAAASLDAAEREQAIQMAFNALFYTPAGTTTAYTVSGVKFDTFADAYLYWVANGSVAGALGTTTVSEGSLADVVFGLYKSSTNVADDFGRPQTAYMVKTSAKAVSVCVATPVLSYTTAVKESTVFADLGLTANYTGTANKVVDGAPAGNQDITYNGGAITGTGNGVLTEVYNTGTAATPVYTFVIMNTYVDTVATVTAATAVTKENVTLTGCGTLTFNVAGLKVDDVVLVTKTATKIVSVEKVTATELTPTSFSGTTSFVAGGTTYKYSEMFTGTKVAGFTAVNAYLDSYGYVIKLAGVTPTTNYAVVLSVNTVTATWPASGTTYQAQLLKADGTVEIVTTATLGTANKLVTYTVGANSVYTLTDASATEVTGKTLAITKGAAVYTWNDLATLKANAKTIYLVRSGAGSTASPYTYAAYTGIANVPSLSGAAVSGLYLNDANGFAKVIYLEGATSTAATSSDVIFVSGVYAPTTVSVSGAPVTYYTATALVNGTATTLDFASDYAMGVYTVKSADANGYVTLATPAGTAVTSIAKYTADSGVIAINGITYAVTTGTVVYTYSVSTGAITAAALSSIKGTETAGRFTVDKTNTNIVTAIYVPVA